MSADHLVEKALKRIGKVHPVIAQGAEEIIRRAYKQGIYVLFSDGYRSVAEQNELYKQGRSKPGPVVTNATGGQSIHNYGLALDMFITNKAGETASWPADKLTEVAQIAKSLGFEWGGDWKSFKDIPHIQMTGGLSVAQLRAGQKPNISLNNAAATKPPKQSAGASGSKPKSKWIAVSGNWTGQTLKKWHYGKPVEQLQKSVGVKADGYFGADTEKAVRAAQKSAGIAVDGMAGMATYRKIKSKAKLTVDGKGGKATIKAIQKDTGSKYTDGVFSSQPKNSVTEAFYSGITYGSKGSPSVGALQKKVGAKVDNKLGPATVSSWQKYVGTPVDGVISRPYSAVIAETQKRLNAGTF